MNRNAAQYITEAKVDSNMHKFMEWSEHDAAGIAFRQAHLDAWHRMENQGLQDVGDNVARIPAAPRVVLNLLYQMARQVGGFDPYGNETRYAEEASNNVYLAPFQVWIYNTTEGHAFSERNQAAWTTLTQQLDFHENQPVHQILPHARVVLELLYRIARHASQYEPPAQVLPVPPGPHGDPPGPPDGPHGPPGGPPGGGPYGGGPPGGGPPGAAPHGGGPPGAAPHGGPPGGPPGGHQEGAALPPSQDQEVLAEQGPSKKARK